MNDTYITCWTADEWRAIVHQAFSSRFVGIDVESTPDPNRPDTTSALRVEDGACVAGYGLAWIDQDGVCRSAYCPVRHHRPTAGGVQPKPREIAGILSQAIEAMPRDHGVVVANMMMELSFFLAEGIVWPLQGQIHDVQVAARVLNKGVGLDELIGLKVLAAEHLGRELQSKTELDSWLTKRKLKPGKDIWKAPVAMVSPYCQDDARDALHLWMKWSDEVYQEPTNWWWFREPNKLDRKDLYELESEAATLAVTTSVRGSRFDVELCRKIAAAADMLQVVVRRWIQDAFEMPNLNPGSGTQVRGLLFAEAFGLVLDKEHMTDSFKKKSERDQQRLMSRVSDERLEDYASLDIEALKAYEKQMPEKADVFFMLAVYRKCQTVLTWFRENTAEYGGFHHDPWWRRDENTRWLWLIFHRLRTVGTVSGRMASSEYNSQNVPKRFGMLINADRLLRILAVFLPPNQFEELRDALQFAEVRDGDEAKTLGVVPGSMVVDFSIRRMLIARPGYNFRTHDLSQVEMKGFAHFSGNVLLCEGYGSPLDNHTIQTELAALRSVLDGADPAVVFKELDVSRHERAERENKFDIHQFVGDEIGIMRKPAKAINFGIVYGMGKRKLCRSLGWEAIKGEEYLGRYHSKFPEIEQIQAAIKERLRTRGYIFDPFGRRYHLPVSKAYIGLNRLIQGWAAGMFKMAFVRVCGLFASPAYGGVYDRIMRRRVMDKAKVLSCVHDEFDSEVPEEMDDGNLDFAIRSCMTVIGGLKVPLSVTSERSRDSWDNVEPHAFFS